MAVTFDAAGTFFSDTSGTLNPVDYTGMTVGAGATGLLIMFVAFDGGTSPTSVTWDQGGTNQAATLIDKRALTGGLNNFTQYFYGRINPTAGNKTLRISYASAPGLIGVSAVSVTGSNTTSVAAAFTNANGQQVNGSVTVSPASVTVTSATGNLVVAQFLSNDAGGTGTISAVNNTSVYLSASWGGTAFGSAANRAAGAASVSMTATITGVTVAALEDWASQGINIVAGVNPTSQDDWPNPFRPRSNPQDWIASSNLALIAPTASQPRAPVLWRRKPLPDITAAQSSPLGSNAALIPAAAVQAPFSQDDWPVPSSPRRNPQDWSDSFKLPLQQTLPLNQDDWPVPSGPRRNPQDWSQATAIYLTVPPVFPAIAQYNWPNPQGPRRNPQDWQDSFQLPLQQVLPPRQTDWPVPRGPRPLPQAWIAPTNIALVSFVQPPFSQRDWPLPNGPMEYGQDWLETGPALLVPLPPKPFAQTEWPNPRGRPPLLQSWTDSFKLPLQQVLPPHQTDWPNPRGPRPLVQDWCLPLNLNTATTVVAAAPFNQDDWPVPRGPRSSFQLGWTDWLTLQVLPPPANYNWPNPRAAKPQVQDWIQALPVALNTPPTPPPIAQHDWPVPSGSRRNPQDWQDRFKLPLQQVLPPTQKNWPLPTPAARRNPQDYWLPTNIALFFTVQVMPPIAQRDWPVPRGARQPVITARDFVTGSRPPVPPVYNPDLTLQNEVTRVRYLDNLTGRVRYLKNEVRS